MGSSHHRKTRSRSSIDWSLLADPAKSGDADQDSDSLLASRDTLGIDQDDQLSMLQKEQSSGITLPTYIDRLHAMGSKYKSSARWFPYTYEVIIAQWAAVLTEQRRLGKHGDATTSGQNSAKTPNSSSKDALSQAALRSVGVAIAGTPMLLEVIKQSLGFRVASLFRGVLSKHDGRDCPPLVKLDESTLSSLEQVIAMITDVCLDSTNFDSWDLRQTSLDVNDALIRFLRDMFSFLTPGCVHRLILSYFSRFTAKDAGRGQDKDSLIGLRCSWEVTKMRLNSATALVRFVDIIRVNSPQMLNWGSWWTERPNDSADRFFDNMLDRYAQYGFPSFVEGEGSKRIVSIPPMRPHWMVELLVDICLIGTEHVEQYIQNRSASLIHEVFWTCSQGGLFDGISSPVCSMFITFVEKILSHVAYLSSFSPKSQLRKDLLPCVVFVLQGAAPGMQRALWRRLCRRMEGKGQLEKYRNSFGSNSNGFGSDSLLDAYQKMPNASEQKQEPDALDMFSLLNLALRTLEFEGSEEHIELESAGETRDNLEVWRREYLLSPSNLGPRPEVWSFGGVDKDQILQHEAYTSTVSRRWQAHDGSIVIVNTCHQIVTEMYTLLRSSPDGRSFLNPAVNSSSRRSKMEAKDATESCRLTYDEVVLFVRAATSLYLHPLALKESDIVITRTLRLSAEVIKIFGIRLFLEAVGQTLQHWMRVILLHCGARRATVRIESTDLLELVLRSTWECFGSFFRIR